MRRVLTRSRLAGVLAVAALAGAVAGPAAIARTAGGPVAGGGRSWKPHIRSAERYAERRAGNPRFAIIDLSGRMHRFHAAETAPTASVLKVMLMVAYLGQPSVRDRELNSTDKHLLGPMIRRSDNNAASRVAQIDGPGRIDAVGRESHMRDFHYDPGVWGLSRTSARDQASFMYNLRRYIPKRHRAYAFKLLSSIVPSQRWGIAQVKPAGWKLYFKSGWGSGTGWVDHQVALLKRQHQKIALAVLTQLNPSHLYGEDTERGIAKRLLRGIPR